MLQKIINDHFMRDDILTAIYHIAIGSWNHIVLLLYIDVSDIVAKQKYSVVF